MGGERHPEHSKLPYTTSTPQCFLALKVSKNVYIYIYKDVG